MIVSVASGKGGTGKTTVAVNLASTQGSRIRLLDCDVEEPNARLFFKGAACGHPETVTRPIPEVDEGQCDGCGECSRFCEFKALAVLGRRVLVFPELCHGCGGCMRVCPKGAIREIPKRIGTVSIHTADGLSVVEGRLDVGVAMAPPLIHAVKKKALAPEKGDTILDAPPGTACPVTATLHGSDYVLLVTEPTPFGLHDLTLAVEMVRELRLPFGVVINRADSGDDRVREYCRKEWITVLAEIPDDRRIAEAYSRGELLVEALPEYRTLFKHLWDKVRGQA